MQTSLLQTKLIIPPQRSELISRPRLLELLNEGLRHKFTLISAPAGYGKTTLVRSWIARDAEGEGQDDDKSTVHTVSFIDPSRVAWVSLDERDNDPSQFWHYVIAAFQNIDTTIGKTLQAILGSAQHPSFEALVTELINDLVGYQPDNEKNLPLLLVLDDYHWISSEIIHKSINFLIDHLPPSLHLVITTRSDPPLQLSLRRVRSEITQIRASDLSFTQDEAVEFFNTLMGLSLSETEIAVLESRTEGWIASLQLAALSLQDQVDRHAFITDFAGDDRYIADYLVDQVFHQQPENIQSFLLRTSILNQLCAPLCDAVTDQNQSREILRQLEQANLFLNPLDNRREWYRYHQLFGDLLRQRLYESYDASEIADLHQQAYKWYEENGALIEAVDHALLAKDYQRAALLIQDRAQEIFMQFHLDTLSKWIKALPEQIVTSQPVLIMILAWALLATGHTSEVEQQLQRIESGLDVSAGTISSAELQKLDPQARGALIEVMVVRSVIAINQFNIPKTLELCQQVLPFLEDNSRPHLFNPPLFLRTVVVLNMGMAYELSGQGNAAMDNLTEAVSLSLEQANNNILPIAIGHLGQLQMLQGHLNMAEKTYRQGLQLAIEITAQPSPMAGIAEIGLGNLFYEWNDLDRAVEHFNTGIALAKRWNHAESLLAGYTGLARLHQAQGDGAGALVVLQKLSDMLQKFKAEFLLPAVDTNRTRLLIAQGKLTEANQWLQTSKLTLDGDLAFLLENDYLTFSRLLIAQERWTEADALIARLLDFVERGERWGRLIELLLLKALVFNGQGKLAQAEETLLRALSLAEPEGYVRLFVDEGPLLANLLYKTASSGTRSGYIEKLLNAFHVEKHTEARSEDVESLSSGKPAEPISDRELEVLQCIVEGLSNREIAYRLTISLSTVKSHTRNIYGKLGVNSRTQAIAQALAWGILPPK